MAKINLLNYQHFTFFEMLMNVKIVTFIWWLKFNAICLQCPNEDDVL